MSGTIEPPGRLDIKPRSPRRELTIHLFHLFLVAISESEKFHWPRFTGKLEYEALKESLRLAGGNGREAASLLGIKYNTFMKRAHKHGLIGRGWTARGVAAGGVPPAADTPSPGSSRKDD